MCVTLFDTLYKFKRDKTPINQKQMNILKLNNGKVELRKDSGSLIRTIGNGDAVDADLNSDGSLILVTTVKGKVELRKESGSLIRTIGNGDATSAKFSGRPSPIRKPQALTLQFLTK